MQEKVYIFAQYLLARIYVSAVLLNFACTPTAIKVARVPQVQTGSENTPPDLTTSGREPAASTTPDKASENWQQDQEGKDQSFKQALAPMSISIEGGKISGSFALRDDGVLSYPDPSLWNDTSREFAIMKGGSIDISGSNLKFGPFQVDDNWIDGTRRPYQAIRAVKFDVSSHTLWLSVRPQNTPTEPLRVLVYDTKNINDLTDDVLLGEYNQSNFPGLSEMYIPNKIEYDPASGLLYFATMGIFSGNDHFKSGVAIIDTKKTATLADDELLGYYNADRFGPSLSWSVQDLDLSSGLDAVFVSLRAESFTIKETSGIVVIARNGTKTLSDDVIVEHYFDSSVPVATKGLRFYATQYDDETGLLYTVATTAGEATIVDTKKNLIQSDDAIVARYNATSNPAIVSNGGSSIVYDPGSGILAIVGASSSYTSGYGITAIDTKKTISPSDDTVAGQFAPSSTALQSTCDYCSVIIDGSQKQILAIGRTGLEVFHLNDLSNIADNTRDLYEDAYLRNTLYFEATNNRSVIMAGKSTLALFSLDSNAPSAGHFESSPISVGQDVPVGLRITSSQVNPNPAVKVYYRFGGEDMEVREDFSEDLAVSNKISDFFNRGKLPASATQSGGILRLAGNSVGVSTFGTIEMTIPQGLQQPGNLVQARMRRASLADPSTMGVSADNFTNSFVYKKNEWQTISDPCVVGCSHVGFYLSSSLAYGWNQAQDRLEIDSIRVEKYPDQDSHWKEAVFDQVHGAFKFSPPVSIPKWFKYRIVAQDSAEVVDLTVTSVDVIRNQKLAGAWISSPMTIPPGYSQIEIDLDNAEFANVKLEHSEKCCDQWSEISLDSLRRGPVPGSKVPVYIRVTIDAEPTLVMPTLRSVRLLP